MYETKDNQWLTLGMNEDKFGTEEILGDLGCEKSFIHDLAAKNIVKIKS